MADVEADVAGARIPKKRAFKKFRFRGVNLDALVDMSIDELVKLFPAIGLAECSRELEYTSLCSNSIKRKKGGIYTKVAKW
ncbi:hypothetical protein DVH24_016226 [Malus domestica]|uniref:40S ribosomal protein S15 n=1 Tax=Malus domestica TaxID=3750 RepID=A0A498HT08_MALDO|nr:hypothetical protein DVH24_016226 [Malus domestica]